MKLLHDTMLYLSLVWLATLLVIFVIDVVTDVVFKKERGGIAKFGIQLLIATLPLASVLILFKV